MRQRAKSTALLLTLTAAAALSVGCAGNKSKGGSDYSSFEGSSSSESNGPSEKLLEAKRSAEAAEAEASQLRQEKQKAASN